MTSFGQNCDQSCDQNCDHHVAPRPFGLVCCAASRVPHALSLLVVNPCPRLLQVGIDCLSIATFEDNVGGHVELFHKVSVNKKISQLAELPHSCLPCGYAARLSLGASWDCLTAAHLCCKKLESRTCSLQAKASHNVGKENLQLYSCTQPAQAQELKCFALLHIQVDILNPANTSCINICVFVAANSMLTISFRWLRLAWSLRKRAPLHSWACPTRSAHIHRRASRPL